MDPDAFLQYLLQQKKFTPEILQSIERSIVRFQATQPTSPTSVEQEKLLRELEAYVDPNETPADTVLLNTQQDLSPQNKTVRFNGNIAPLPKNIYRYLVLETLGKGGMGVVQRVQDCILGREVALKTLRFKENQPQEQFARLWRLQREAAITALLEHPHIVPLYDLQQQGNGEIYFTMRKVEGETLTQLLEKKRKGFSIDETRVLSLFFKITDAVAYAHSRGVIHRDLKPDNIMVGKFGEVYVMDWGIAKVLPESPLSSHLNASQLLPKQPQDALQNAEAPPSSPEKTENGIVSSTFRTTQIFKNATGKTPFLGTIGGLGTPGYMPPEQVEDAASVSYSADIYALAKILRQIYTTLSPLEEIANKIDQMKMVRTSSKNNTFQEKTSFSVPKDIEAIIAKATKTNLLLRYSTLSDFVADIERYQTHRLVSAREYTLWEVILISYKRNKKRIAVFVLLFATLLLSFFYQQWKKQQEQWKQKTYAYQIIQQVQDESLQISKEDDVSEQISKLFELFHYTEDALKILPRQPHFQKTQIDIGTKLLKIACSTQDYQLATYLSNRLKSLTSFSSQDQLYWENYILHEKHKILKQHLSRLDFWVTKARNETLTPELREEAILEISKMPEKEIFFKICELLEQMVYNEVNATKLVCQDNASFLLVSTLGYLRNPAGDHFLLTLLNTLIETWPIRTNKITPEEIHFLMYVLQVLEKIISTNHVNNLIEILLRVATREPLFWERINYFGQKFTLQLDSSAEALPTKQLEKAYLLITQHEYLKAIEICSQLIEEKTRSTVAAYLIYHLRGEAKRNNNDLEGALQDFAYSQQSSTFAYFPTYRSKAFVLRKQKKWEEAKLAYQEAIELFPKSSEIYRDRGDFWHEQEEYFLALEDYQKAIQIDPEYADVYLEIATIYDIQEKFKEAFVALNKAIEIAPKKTRAYYLLGNIHERMGNTESAVLQYLQIIQMDPNFAFAYYRLSFLKGKEKDFKNSLYYLDHFLQRESQYALAYQDRGRIHFMNGNLTEALADLDRAIALDASLAEAFVMRGGIYFRQQELEKALANYDEAIRLEPQEPFHYLDRVLIFLDQERYADAFQNYFQMLKLRPELSFHTGINSITQDMLRTLMSLTSRGELTFVKEQVEHFLKILPKKHPYYPQIELFLENLNKKMSQPK